MDSESVHHVDAWTNQNIACASFGALALQIWEFAHYFLDEVEYLFKSRFTAVKMLYLWSRYVPLATQIVNITLTHKMYESMPQRPQLCVRTFAYKAIAGQQSLTCVELIILVRVYALYNRTRRAKYFLCTVFLANFAMEIWGSSQVVRVVIMGKSCIAEKIPASALVTFGVTAGFFQGLMLSMTVFKYVIGHHYGWARTPLTSLILREGIVVCFLIFGMVVVNVLYEYKSLLTVKLALRNAAFAWYISILSVTGCRLILDMRKVAIPHQGHNPGEEDDTEIELTSNLDLNSE